MPATPALPGFTVVGSIIEPALVVSAVLARSARAMTSFSRSLMVALIFALVAGGPLLGTTSVVAQDGEVAASQASPETGDQPSTEPPPTGVMRVVALDCTLA